jgi:ABC-2 type transport system permease protein
MEIHGIVYIPQESEKNLKLNNKVIIKSFLNTSRFLVSNDINKAVTDVAFSVNDEVRQKYFLTTGLSIKEAENAIEPVNTDIRPVFNVTETYGDFLIPGILIMILHQTLLIGLAESIAKEREEMSLGELYSAAYNNTAVAIAGKSAFYFILFGAYSVFNLTIVFSIFRINLSGNIFVLSVLFSLLLISVILMCFLISSFFKRKILALQIIAFTSYPLFFITGYAFPRHSIPPGIRSFSDLFAITPFFEAYKRLTQMGAGFTNILPEFIHILLLTISVGLLALLRMHFLFRNEKQKDVQRVQNGNSL